MVRQSARTGTAQRRATVLAEVLAGRGTVAELTRALGISAATARRDLQFLAERGQATRTYGGAVRSARPIELTLDQKAQAHRACKDEIAAHAASLVADGDVLVLDAGTTTGRLAHHLRERSGLTVLSNGVNTLLTLRDCDAIELIVLGGRLRHTSQALLGPLAEDTLRHVFAGKAFLGADGVDPVRGLSCPTLEQASLKTLMAARSREVYVLADHSKLGEAPFAYFAALPSPVTVITDSRASPAQLAALSRNPQLAVVQARTGLPTAGGGRT
jgi:DeoR family fructose operon transcriptional repressor